MTRKEFMQGFGLACLIPSVLKPDPKEVYDNIADQIVKTAGIPPWMLGYPDHPNCLCYPIPVISPNRQNRVKPERSK